MRFSRIRHDRASNGGNSRHVNGGGEDAVDAVACGEADGSQHHQGTESCSDGHDLQMCIRSYQPDSNCHACVQLVRHPLASRTAIHTESTSTPSDNPNIAFATIV